MHKKLGNRWSTIAAELPGRTDNEVKNYWHTSLKKRVDHKEITDIEETKSKDIEYTQDRDISFHQVTPPASSQTLDITGPLSPLSSSSEFSSADYSDHNTTYVDDFSFLDEIIESVGERFWDDLSNIPSEIKQNNTNCNFKNQDTNVGFLVSPNHSSDESFVLDNDFGSFLDTYNESTIDSFWTQPYEADMHHVSSQLLTPLPMESEYFSLVYDDDIWN